MMSRSSNSCTTSGGITINSGTKNSFREEPDIPEVPTPTTSSINRSLYKKSICNFPSVIASLEQGTQLLSQLAIPTGIEENVFPSGLIDEFDEDCDVSSLGDSGDEFTFFGDSLDSHNSFPIKSRSAPSSSRSGLSAGAYYSLAFASRSANVHNSSSMSSGYSGTSSSQQHHHHNHNYHHGFKHDINSHITQIIALENSMINILEDLLVYSESHWDISFPLESTNCLMSDSDYPADFHIENAESQTNNRRLKRSLSSRRGSLIADNDDINKQKRFDFFELLNNFEKARDSSSSSSVMSDSDSDDDDSVDSDEQSAFQCGIKIHEFLQLNMHLEQVQKCYQLVSSLRNENENYTRSNGFDLSKERASTLLEDGERLERFYDKVIDKVSQFQTEMSQLNSLLELS